METDQTTEDEVAATPTAEPPQLQGKNPAARALRPRDQIKPPQKFANYVAK